MAGFLDTLRTLLERSGRGPILVHSDLFRVRSAIPAARGAREMLASHLRALERVSDGAGLLFPAFNYEFLRTGRYDPEVDPSQVGPLSEHARSSWAQWRIGPPVFNFTGRLEPRPRAPGTGRVDPFDTSSLFGHLHRHDGRVLLYGAPFASFTTIHYVERLAGGPSYRYDKLFRGSVRASGSRGDEVVLCYHCRPLGKDLRYDWPRLQREAERSGAISTISTSGAAAIVVRLESLCAFWSEQLDRDPLYLLDPETRRWAEPVLDRLGRRFVLSDFEPPGPEP